MAAKKKKKKASKKRGSKCKIVTVCGKRRKICWGKKGITSNTKAPKKKKK